MLNNMSAKGGSASGGNNSQKGLVSASHKEDGFTLIEILVVIGMIAILATIVIIAINPARQFALGRNTQRNSNVNAILNAIGQNMVDNKGTFTCPSNPIPLVDPVPSPLVSTTGSEISTSGLDLRTCLSSFYISEIPVDPQNGTAWNGSSYNTGYRVFHDTNGRITVFAPSTELTLDPNAASYTCSGSIGKLICVTR